MTNIKRCPSAWLPVLAAAALVSAGEARSQFLEPDVTVVRTHNSALPESFGWASETIGDINGDGAPEYMISAILSSAGGPAAGRVVLYSGADGSVLNEVIGNAGNRLGFALAGPGDIDGDGVPDYAMGGPGAFGLPGPQPGRLLILSGADHSVILDVAGPVDRTLFGYDINAAGDVNGDGVPDLVVGAPVDGTNLPSAGAAHAISGADGSILWTYPGTFQAGFVGTGVSGVGDLTGDGLPEQVAGGVQAGKKLLGEAYVLSGLDGSVVAILKPKKDGFNFAHFFVHDAGDATGDGINDIYIGDFGFATGGDTGRAYIWSGGDLEERDIINGEDPGEGFGIGRGVGDVDGDGHADLFIAGFNNSDGAALGGRGYLYSGRNNKLIRTMTGTVAGAQLGFDAIGLGDITGDGLTDYLLTGVGVAQVIAGNPVP